MEAEQVDKFLQEFKRWAEQRGDIRAVALVGSHARSQARPDSDVDLVVICARTADYLADLSWTTQFGEVREHQIEDYGKVTSVRVWYTDGREVEYGMTDEDWAALPLDEGTRQVMSDGMRVLYEQEHLLSRHRSATAPHQA